MRNISRTITVGLVTALPAASQPLPSALDRYIRAEMELNHFPGIAVALVRGAEVAVAAYGVRDLHTAGPMTPQTPVELASVSKPLTALAVALLEREGAISLELPVSKYLPDFNPPHPGAAGITIRHLLEHTSGLTRGDDRRVPCCGDNGRHDLRDAVRALSRAAPRDTPGKRFRYANGNYVLLAALVERVSGQPFPAFMRERVFLPLGMTRTTLDAAQSAAWDLSAQHERRWGEFHVVPQSFSGWYGSSLVKAPVEDVARWLAAFLRGMPDFGPAGAAAEWLKNKRRAPYQMGWYVYGDADWLAGETALEHTGFIWGANTAVVAAPRRRLAVAVLINAGVTRAGPIARGLLARLAGLPAPPPQRASFTSHVDNWAMLITAAGAVLAAITFFTCLRACRDWRTGRRRVQWNTARLHRARSLLLAAMAAFLVYLLLVVLRPSPSMPASLQLALPLLGASTAAFLLAHAFLGLTRRN
jgi:CubicO group peptidase (beta-lactamase class C family)